MSRTAIILAVIIASASIASAEPATGPADNSAETPSTSTDHPSESATEHPHHHYHQRRHHRFHPVHDASELFHHVTGTQPVSPKPVNN